MKRFHRDEIPSGVEHRTGPLSSSSHLTTPLTKKRKLQFGQSSNLDGKQNTRLIETFRKLDPSNPAEAKRINTRKKQVQKGKNTLGYSIYIEKVPKESRKKIPQHPSTPDYRADIPNRRWLGQLKAWRISLHQYDPSDLKSDITCESKEQNIRKDKSLHSLQGCQTSTKAQSVKHKEIEDATKNGLNVEFDFQSSENHDAARARNDVNGIEVNEKDKESNFVSIDTDVDQELDKWESNRVSGVNDDELLDYDDSDDDIL